MTALIDSELGLVFVSVHGYDRMSRHSIDDTYAGQLIDDVDEWVESGERTRGEIERDGVVWRLVLEPEDDQELRHDWDLVTVVPVDVDVETAVASGFDEVDAINLALYAN